MGDHSAIGWTEATWNPTTGCSKVSPGCDNCYAIRSSVRLVSQGVPAYRGVLTDDMRDWSGRVNSVANRLDQPLRWRKPRLIFVNSMSDLFHPEVPYGFIVDVFAVMAGAPHHTFQVLTKRPQRMASIVGDEAGERSFRDLVKQRWETLALNNWSKDLGLFFPWPLPNVWLGTSVENQRFADLRIPHLLRTPAAVRWLSIEPLLGPIDLGIGDPHAGHESDDVHGFPHPRVCLTCSTEDHEVEFFRRYGSAPDCLGLHWVVVGGESGPGYRDMHPDWLANLAVECHQARVPLFVKQDSHTRSGQQGRIPDDLWARKDYPKAVSP